MAQSTVIKEPGVAPLRRGRPVQTRGFPRVQLRLPPALYDKVVASAGRRYLSLNSEIIRRLAASFARSAETDPIRKRLIEVMERGEEAGWADDLRAQIDAIEADAIARADALRQHVEAAVDAFQIAAPADAQRQGRAREPRGGTKVKPPRAR
jgi:hypothetical protein